MKICFIADASHPNVQNWVNYFANVLGHDIYLISFNKSKRDLGKVNILYIKFLCKSMKFRYIFAIREIKKVVRKISPDILIGYRPASYGFLAACSGFHPLVIALQGQSIVFPSNSIIKKIFAKYAVKKADLINAWGEHMTKDLMSCRVPKDKIEIFPRGVRIPEAVSHRHTNDVFTLISTRGLNTDYNFDQIIFALPIVIKKIKNIKYLIAGDGEDKERLETLVKKLQLEECVEFLGKVDYGVVMELVKSSDVYVSAVPTDGVSSSLLEAMASGTFPIVIDNIANREWISDNINGFLFPKDEVEILAEKIINAACMPEMRKITAETNFQIVKKRANWDRNMKKMEKRYLELRSMFSRK